MYDNKYTIATCWVLFLLVGISLTGSSYKPDTTIISVPTEYIVYYPAFKLHVVASTKESTRKSCSGIPHLDNGDLIGSTQMNGCWDPVSRTIYIRSDRPELLVHELCHAGGSTPKDCDRTYLPSVQ